MSPIIPATAGVVTKSLASPGARIRAPQREAQPASTRALTATAQSAALLHLGRWLRATGYSFVTVTPETHRRVNARVGNVPARCLRDVFGWSRPFRPSLLPEAPRTLLERAGALEHHGALLHSAVRFSTLEARLFAHSAYPTLAADAVFFGPDTSRFASFIRSALNETRARKVRVLADVGCGSGAGGIAAALLAKPEQLILADINPTALRFAAANAALAGAKAVCVLSDGLQAVDGALDLIVANPPYLVDPLMRIYRDGGGAFGGELSLRIVRDSLARLAPGGRLLLYSGAPVISGEDQLWRGLQPLLATTPVHYHYQELDPDVFGEELDSPAYAQVERIAAVGLVVERL